MAQHSLFRDHEHIQNQQELQLDSDSQSISSCLHTPQQKQESYRSHKKHHPQPSTSQSLENGDRDRSGVPKLEEANKQNGTQVGSSPQNDGSTVATGKTVFLRKLNAQAPEFVPRGGSSSLSPLQGPTIPPLQQNRKSALPRLTIPQKPNSQVYSSPRLPSQFSPIPSQVDNTGSCSSNSLSKGGLLTEELRQKIVKQVEFYFSDANLIANDYLMKFVNKDPEGFVPIPVIASFKKVRSLVTNYALVTAALRTSSQLVISEDGKKVKRASPMSDAGIEELQSRTVVAENLPENHSNENIVKVFATVGTVKMVHICHPQAVEPSSPLGTRFTKTDMLVSNKLHALVEYESVEQAEKAVAELNDERNWRSGLRVRLLLRRTGKPVNQSRGRKVGSDNMDGIGEEEEVSTSETVNDKHLEDCPQHADFVGEEQYSTDKEGGKKGRGRGRGRGHGRSQYHNGRSYTVGLPQSANSTISELQGKQPPGPRMPDGTRGFTMGRGKPLYVTTV
ncbi:la-related protein 6C isoform X2 [Cryptomeria japonica]|uniref:la-related protein 6C isoform X2 n=1 Tax=Cryptomeria japonica TaxID=3369 RepID=UPI0027DAB325|nr:la-related protein 6C isoform X2 [Cryptomeria japonica]